MEYRCCKMYDPEAVDVVRGLRLAEIMNCGYFEESSPSLGGTQVVSSLKELTVSDSLVCSCCRKSFDDSVEQRNHYKLDWHRYNLKRALSGNEPVTEDHFLVTEGDISSISASDTDLSSADESEESKPIASLEASTKVRRHIKVFFQNEKNQLLSVYKCLLQARKQNLLSQDLINLAVNVITKPKKWMIVMLGGGHFAAAIFDDEKVIQHKTFHCYTVRAKQGGSQSTRDKRGGSHPKSAGASLRRYNEQALCQHVQEIMSAWSASIAECNLILYRAAGPWNRSTLFGGKKAPLNKNDDRLRNISFPTRRPTLKEVKRVHEILTNIEIYGCAEEFKTKFPKSPDKRIESSDKKVEGEGKRVKQIKKSRRKIINRRSKSRDKSQESHRKQTKEEQTGIAFGSTSESSSDGEEDDFDLVWNECIIDFNDLREYEEQLFEPGEEAFHGKKRKKPPGKKVQDSEVKTEKDLALGKIQKRLLDCCQLGDDTSFGEILDSLKEAPEEHEEGRPFTDKHVIDWLNSPLEQETGNTLLHVCAHKCLVDSVKKLLLFGADPTIRNKKGQTPYQVAGHKKSKKSFCEFVARFPDRFDMKKANIPRPLTEEEEREKEERDKEKRKAKQAKEKIKKQKKKEKQREEEEKEKFLALSDREKCALAAERRLLASITANTRNQKPPVLSRCFQCGFDMTGKIPFEYENNRFCSMPCLKAHRAKTKLLT